MAPKKRTMPLAEKMKFPAGVQAEGEILTCENWQGTTKQKICPNQLGWCWQREKFDW